jgi:glycosyltransferase involved in cell wall biosynthesis
LRSWGVGGMRCGPSVTTRRILYVIETLGHGGAEHQLVATVRRLDRARFEPIVCHLRGPDYLAPQLRDAGIRVLCLDIPAGKQHWPEVLLKLRSVTRDTDANLIHTSLLEADVLGGLAGKLAKVPVVSTLCNISGDRARLLDNPRNNRLKFGVTNWVWGGALRSLHRHSIAISRAVLDSAVQTFGMDPSRISIIYRGIDDGKPLSGADKSEVRERIGLPGASPLLLTIGRLAPQKGHKHLIAALPTLLTSFPAAKLAIVGEGWLRSQLEAQARALGVAESVRFLGKRTDVPDLLAACDLFVFPSLFEGLGVSLLEASYAGCACISSDTGPIPEIIENGATGLLVPPGDSQALGRALLRLAGSPELARQLGRSAQTRARQRFMLSDKVTDLQRCYEDLFARAT